MVKRGRVVRSSMAILMVAIGVVSASSVVAQSIGEPGRDSKGPNPLKNVYFCEQHLHTNASADAYIQGSHKNDINDAFDYNKGKPVKKYLTGETLQRRTPYDWTAVTDHSEYMGLLNSINNKPPPVDLNDPIIKDLLSGDPDKMNAGFSMLAGYFTRNERYQPFENKAFYKQELGGAIICTTTTVGSSLGGASLMGVGSLGLGPKAMLFSQHVDSVSIAGLLMDDIWNSRRVIAIDLLGDDFINTVKSGDKISIVAEYYNSVQK